MRFWWNVITSVWRDKWEALLMLVGFTLTVLAGDAPPWMIAVYVVLTAVLMLDIVQAVRHTSFLLREKHIPIVVVIGRNRDAAKAMLSDVLAVMSSHGFDPDRYQREFGVDQDDWMIHQEDTLDVQPDRWLDTCRRFQRRIDYLEKLSGKKVYHIFLNCPAALALGMGALLNTRHVVVVYHWMPGHGRFPYVPVIDAQSVDGEHPSVLDRLRQTVSPPECVSWQDPQAWTPEPYMGLHLARISPDTALGAVAAAEGAAYVPVHNCYGDTLTLDSDWTRVAAEAGTVIRQVLNRPEVKRVRLALNAPMPIAMAIGMSLGIHVSVSVYNYYTSQNRYAHVYDVDKLRPL